MPEIAIMTEGQDGMNWDRWTTLAREVETLGFDGLFRSDHFTNPEGPRKDSLELWVSLTWLADNTEDLEFGPLVTPTSFRDPVFTARMGKDVDALSDGRFTLGVGAGWQEREHDAFGYDLLSVPDRFDRFEESLEVIRGLLRETEPVSFSGEYYDLDGAQLLPRPELGRPPILVGGNGRNRTLPLAAQYADEWNGVFVPPAEFAELNERLDELLESVGRRPEDVRRSLMTRVCFGRDESDLDSILDGDDPDDLHELGVIFGGEAEVCEAIDRLAEAGADRVMLQFLEVDDLDRLRGLADAVL
ncbi:MAG: TIGR03560 family F420-dependent LLM class oxidoreductase [Natronomonas sp.]